MNVIEAKGLPPDGNRREAVEWFLRVRSEGARIEDLPELRSWLEADPRNATAYQEVSAAWGVVGNFASAPEIVAGRRDALEDSHRARQRRPSSRLLGVVASRSVPEWSLVAGIAAALVAATWWFAWPHWTMYSTARGERRSIQLEDGSVLTMDANTSARVRYTEKGREILLDQGQAQFSVAKDPLRPFQVRAREQTVVALGTQFDVELVSHTVLVTLIEGHVAVAGVTSAAPADESAPGLANAATGQHASFPTVSTRKPGSAARGKNVVELTAGEALRVHDDGRAVLVAHVDLERAMAWQVGKIVFDNEGLVSAVERINRYTNEQIRVDPSIATLGISGLFNAGDTDAFIGAVTAYFPVDVTRDGNGTIYLTRRSGSPPLPH